MAAVAGIERRFAHQAVYTGLGAQPAVGVLALHFHTRALDTGNLPGAHVDDLAAQAARRTPAQIHAQQHLRPILGLGAARPRLNVEESAVRVHLAAKHALELEMPDLVLEALDRLGDAAGGAVDLADVAGQPRALAPQILGTRRIGPHLRVLELAPNLLEALELAVVLKETPEAS